MAPTLLATVKFSKNQIEKLKKYKNDASPLDAKYQHIISEMIMLRLFSIFEDSVADLAFKIAAGAKYTNGVVPAITTKARRTADSRGLLLTHGRARPEFNLKWTKAQFIRESVEHVIPTTEFFVVNAQAHGQIIDEMRRVRNVLAHNSKSAKTEFKAVIRQTYGANVNISVGAFLTSTRRSTPCNIDRYLGVSEAIISALASGK